MSMGEFLCEECGLVSPEGEWGAVEVWPGVNTTPHGPLGGATPPDYEWQCPHCLAQTNHPEEV